MKYVTLDVDGTTEIFKPAKERPSLEEMQAIVGGLIERVELKKGEMWVNEEGLLIPLKLNPLASMIAGVPIMGRVLLCIRKERGK